MKDAVVLSPLSSPDADLPTLLPLASTPDSKSGLNSKELDA
jgi:hypothetical protein